MIREYPYWFFSDLKTDLKQSSANEEEIEDQEMLDKQRELFLGYIREDLKRSSLETSNKLNGSSMQEVRGISPDTGQDISEFLDKSGQNFRDPEAFTKRINYVHKDVPELQVPVNVKAVELDEKDYTLSNNYLSEARNLDIPVLQVDSGMFIDNSLFI